MAARLTTKGFRNQVCDSIEELAQQVLAYDAQGVAAYHACAAYRERSVAGVKDGKAFKQVRTHANVRALKAFWMDLDVGADDPKKFESQTAAFDGLVEFCGATDLPLPMIVSSGYGIHIYWVLDHEIIPEVWRQTAQGLKALSVVLKFKVDQSCTSDLARVLRPVGTTNRKNAAAPQLVEVVDGGTALNPVRFAAAVAAACAKLDIAPPKEPVRQIESPTERINQQFAVTNDFPPCSGLKVADRCAQLAKIRDTRGNVPEPFWYAGVQLLTHAIEGDQLTHQWSNGYAGYTAQETDRKIYQIKSQALGPTLCATFEDRNPGGCEGCPFRGKISSPAQLGTYVAPAPAPTIVVEVAGVPTTVTLLNPPPPFTRGATGGIFAEIEGITHKIYEYDCFATELAYDEVLGYETCRIRHYLPHEGWKECVVRSSLLAKPAEFEVALRDKHIQPLIRNQMTSYIDAQMRQMRENNKLRTLFTAQGWKEDDTAFVLGERLYRKDEVVAAGFSHSKDKFLSHFRSKGSLGMWRALTWAIGHKGFEPMAFMLLLGFAAPLLKLAGRKGFSVSAHGVTGSGKSTMARFMCSIYGHPEAGWVKRDDTQLARMQRMASYFALPVYMDEATTIPHKQLREMVYAISTGKGKDSMRQDYTLREGGEWATIFVTSTNGSLQGKLQQENDNPEAESMRLVEFDFPRVAAFEEIAKIIPGIIDENYGVAGETYVRNLVAHADVIKPQLQSIIEAAEAEFGMQAHERFWSQAIALTLYGGKLAQEWGLIDFDPDFIKPWLRALTIEMRATVKEAVASPLSVFGEYLNEHIGERLTTDGKVADQAIVHGQRPNRALTQRYERDNKLLFISRKHFYDWLRARQHHPHDLLRWFQIREILIDQDSRKILGAGTDLTGAQVPCWKLNAAHKALAPVLAE